MQTFVLIASGVLIIVLVFFLVVLCRRKKESWSNHSKINSLPKNILQVTKYDQPLYVIRMIQRYFQPAWNYINFTDDTCLEYLKKNPCSKYKHLIPKFLALSGPHRSDLFRYYYLYHHGGVYLDSDFMLYQPFSDFYQGEDFISIQTHHKDRLAIFNGFLVVKRNSPIMLEALHRLYHTPYENLENNYLLVCQDLYQIVQKYQKLQNIKLYREIMDDYNGLAYTLDDTGHLLARHYWRDKFIPQQRL